MYAPASTSSQTLSLRIFRRLGVPTDVDTKVSFPEFIDGALCQLARMLHFFGQH
jgi:hypothetical protein